METKANRKQQRSQTFGLKYFLSVGDLSGKMLKETYLDISLT